jgi:hypothetical protein
MVVGRDEDLECLHLKLVGGNDRRPPEPIRNGAFLSDVVTYYSHAGSGTRYGSAEGKCQHGGRT